MHYAKSTPDLADGTGFTTPEGVFTLPHQSLMMPNHTQHYYTKMIPSIMSTISKVMVVLYIKM